MKIWKYVAEILVSQCPRMTKHFPYGKSWKFIQIISRTNDYSYSVFVLWLVLFFFRTGSIFSIIMKFFSHYIRAFFVAFSFHNFYRLSWKFSTLYAHFYGIFIPPRVRNISRLMASASGICETCNWIRFASPAGVAVDYAYGQTVTYAGVLERLAVTSRSRGGTRFFRTKRNVYRPAFRGECGELRHVS